MTYKYATLTSECVAKELIGGIIITTDLIKYIMKKVKKEIGVTKAAGHLDDCLECVPLPDDRGRRKWKRVS